MVTISRLNVVGMAVRVSIRAVESTVHSMFMVMNWFNIMLVIESVIQVMVFLMFYFMTALMLVLVIIAFVVVSITMSMLIGGHVMI